MPTRTAEPRSGCPINAAAEVIGDRWSLLVLRDVMFGNRQHLRVLQKRSEEGIASNILGEWGLRNRPSAPTLRVRAELLADGGPALWEDFMAELQRAPGGVTAAGRRPDRKRALGRRLRRGPRCRDRLRRCPGQRAVADRCGRRSPSCLTASRPQFTTPTPGGGPSAGGPRRSRPGTVHFLATGGIPQRDGSRQVGVVG